MANPPERSRSSFLRNAKLCSQTSFRAVNPLRASDTLRLVSCRLLQVWRMLGAQALRTKQKVEQKEREKRHKERQRNLEAQRKAASEDAQQQMLEYMAQQQQAQFQSIPEATFPNHSAPNNKKSHQRYSLHSATFSEHMIARDIPQANPPRRSPSSDYTNHLKVSGEATPSQGNRLMRWLGFSKQKPRRMSTFT